MSDLFISYGRADATGLATRLRDDLQKRGYRVWLDTSEIPGGAVWSQNIEDAIEQCDVALTLMSHASLKSQWCRAEQLRAMRKGKRLIPLRVQADAEPPLHLEHLNFLDFSDAERYDEALRDLLSDLAAGQAFRQSGPREATADQPARYEGEKRTAAAFRRLIAELRGEPWLGARHWWPYFLFTFQTLHDVVTILTEDELASPFGRGQAFNTRWDKDVRLYFRPRTPDLYRMEGFRPVSEGDQGRCSMPVYLLFDLEAVLLQPEARFSMGPPDKTNKTYKTPQYFQELPFEQIYHDSWFLPDEREEIMNARQAQVLVPNRLGLEALQVIWMRSPAEYNTLREWLPGPVWRKWRDKITTRRDYQLFNHKWPYVERVHLAPDHAHIHFNPCQSASNCGFLASLSVERAGTTTLEWEQTAFTPDHDLKVDVPAAPEGYRLTLHLDGDLAYAGRYVPGDGLL